MNSSTAAARPLAVELLEPRALLDAGPLVISELCAVNDHIRADSQGHYHDWIEIHNPTANTVALDRWSLTDEVGNPGKWHFPDPTPGPDVTLGSGQYMIVWAPGKDHQDPPTGFYTNFALSGDPGEYLALVRDDGVIASQYAPTYPQQLSDISYGMEMTPGTLLSQGAAGRVLVPGDGDLGTTWTQVGFDDHLWTSATTGVGYDAPQPSLPNESEPNDSLAASNYAAENFAAYSGNLFHLGIKASLSAASEADWYRIGALGAGDVLTVTLSGGPSSRGTASDVQVELYRGSPASPTLVTSDDNDGPGNDALIPRYSITTADTYFIKALRGGSGTAGTYDLGLWLANSGGAPGTGGTRTGETEPNDAATQASDASTSWRTVQYQSHTAAAVGTTSDVDFFRYQFTAGDLVTVVVDSTSTLDAQVAVLNAGGTVLAAETGSSVFSAPYDLDSPVYAFVAPSSGSYYVRVQKRSSSSTSGGYGLDVYLSSNTPPPAPTQGPYSGLIATDLKSRMQGVNFSAYLRVPFALSDPELVNSLKLRIKYDDGFVAYLNGTPVASRNAPGSLLWNSAATAEHPVSQALVFEEIDLSSFIGLLGSSNVLAIHGLNYPGSDGDFLVLPELQYTTLNAASRHYFTTPTPGWANEGGALGLVADTKFSVDRGFFDAPFDVYLGCETPGAEIRYTTDGNAPTATTGTIYTAGVPIHVSTTTTLRAAAFKPGYLSSGVDTQTYIFPADVLHQPANPAGFATTWGHTGAGDYEMDPTVVNDPAYSASMVNNLKMLPTLSLVASRNDWFQNGYGIYDVAENLPEDQTREAAVSAELIYADGSPGFQIDAGVEIVGGTGSVGWKVDKLSMRLKFKYPYGPAKLDYSFFGEAATDTFDTLVLDGGMNYTWHYGGGVSPADQRSKAQYAREPFVADLQNALGGYAPQNRWVNVYIDGLYWGIYYVHERPDEHYAAAYFGGNAEDYYVLKHTSSTVVYPDAVEDPVGAAAARADYAQMLTLVRDAGKTPDQKFQEVQALLDVDNFIDYMLSNYYVGNTDWAQHNWYATRNHVDPAGRWRFHEWDAEHVLKGASDDVTGNNNSGGPTEIHWKLSESLEYRNLFADHVQRHFFNDGPLTPQAAAARYQQWLARVDDFDNPDPAQRRSAVVAESARWGDNMESASATTYTRNAEWLTERNRLLTTYFPGRTNTVLTQFRSRGWFPASSASAPVVSVENVPQHGGQVSPGDDVTLTGPVGTTVYYTLDGSDPRLPGGGVSPTAIRFTGAPLHFAQSALLKTRLMSGSTWSALEEAQFYVGPVAVAGKLAVTELNYAPYAPTATELAINQLWTREDFEFLELRNISSETIELTNVAIAAGLQFNFSDGTMRQLAPGEFVVVASNAAAFQARYPGVAFAGQYVGRLDSNGERLKLVDHFGNMIQEFTYDDAGAWPGRANGDGASLQVIDTAGDYNDGHNWRSSAEYGGSPGAEGIAPLGDIVINEVLTHTDDPLADAIELYNAGAHPVAIGGWYLSDSRDNLRKFRIPDGTTLSPGEYKVYYEGRYVNHVLQYAVDEFGGGANGFALDAAHGDDVWLMKADGSGKMWFADHADFGAAANGESFGRWQDDQGQWHFDPMLRRTLGGPNPSGENGPRVGPLVVSEVMYNPVPVAQAEIAAGMFNADLFEYVEIYNPTSRAVDLTHWRLRGGADYDFPAGTMLAARQALLIVPFDSANTQWAAAFRARYVIGPAVTILGGYRGYLDNDGDRVELQGCDDPPPDEPNYYPHLVEDAVTFKDVAPWPTEVDGTGKSLARQGIVDWGDNAATWAAAAPTPSVVDLPAVVVARQIFYNNSAFDGNDPLAGAPDDAAIAVDKQVLLPGHTATFANYTSFDHGLNGIMMDVAGLGSGVSAADFTLKVGNDNSPGGWTAAPTASVTVRPGAGLGGSDRVELVWPDGAITNCWLQVTMLNNSTTHLAADDVYYFGNAIGETGDSLANAVVDSQDERGARTHHTGFARADVVNPHDFDRDGRVTAADDLIARRSASGVDPLRLITVPVTAASLSAQSVVSLGAPAAVSSGAPPASVPTPSPVALARVSSPAAARSREHVDAAAHDAVLEKAARPESAGGVALSAKWAWLYDLEQFTTRSQPPEKENAPGVALAEVLDTYWA